MRSEISNLVGKGPLQSSKGSAQQITDWQVAIEKIKPPVSDEEAKALADLFPATEDDCFGLAWSLIHLVETSPHWPLKQCLEGRDNPWIELLRLRLRNAGIEVGG
jgi:hypothetical protein